MKNLIVSVALVLTSIVLSSCDSGASSSYEYKVVPISDIDRMVYETLEKQGSAQKLEGGKWKITDIEAAKSENIMPIILNEFGKDGWRLGGINSSQLYIFFRPGN